MPYYFHESLVLRTPRKSLVTALDHSFDIDALSNDKAFLEAVFIATPVLYEEIVKYKAGKLQAAEIEKLQLSVAKYFIRTTSRCTPFGLFSGCSVVNWDKNSSGTQLKSE